MIKKLISLLLAMVIVLGMFAGCSKDEKTPGDETADTQDSKRVAMTLSLWLPTDPSTTDEAAEQVEAAVNKITQAKYDTAIELHLIPRDEYKETVDEKIAAVKQATADKKAAEEARKKALKNKGQKVEETVETDAPVETTIDELGIAVKAYPDVVDTQFDIFYISGYDNYSEYAYADITAPLDGELSGNSKILKSYIYPTFLKPIYDYGTFAIPNNRPVGEYKYLLINKELVDVYDYNYSDLTSFLRTKNFIVDIGNQGLDDVVPLLGPVDAAGIVFWGADGVSDEWSLICSVLTNETEYIDALPPELLLDSTYVSTFKMVRELEALGYVGNGTIEEGKRFAVGIVSGDPASIAKYEEDYYISVYENPVFDEETIYESMFAVSEYSKDVSRSMEIITCINTDKELRTVLQYGVEGIHWEYDDPDTKETISIISDDYKMELTETGNVFMTYPAEGVPMEYWDQYLIQNQEAVSSPYIKMPNYFSEENGNLDLLEEYEALCEEYKEKILNISGENFNAELKVLLAELQSNEIIQKLLDEEDEDSLLSFYTKWQEGMY